jgi:uncharacterized membrane protein YeiB
VRRFIDNLHVYYVPPRDYPSVDFRSMNVHGMLAEATPPMHAKKRIEGFDLARALALLGMVVVHFVLVMSYQVHDPAWLRTMVDLLDGRAAALFMILAGIGISLRTRREAAPPPRDPEERDAADLLHAARVVLVRRGVFLLVAGFVNLVIWKGDILRIYGVSLIGAAVLIDTSNRRLLQTALLFLLAFVVLMGLVEYDTHWNWDELIYGDIWSPAGIVRNLFYDGFRSVFPWTGLFVFGMWLGRLDLQNRSLRRRMLLWAIAVVLAAEAASASLVAYFDAHPAGMDHLTIVALFGTKSMPPLPLFLATAAGTAVAIIVPSLEVAERFAYAFAVRALVAVGQMAFTWYIGHIVIGLGALEYFQLVENQPLERAVATALGFYAVVMLISLAVRSRGHRGPLEWLLRKVAG